MSDDVKDFAYYAAKAEEKLAIIPELVSAEGKRLCVAKADVYARLACGAPNPQESRQISCDQAHPQYDTYHPEGHSERAQAKCVAGIQNTDNFQHSHTCELTVFHTAKHTCACGTEWP